MQKSPAALEPAGRTHHGHGLVHDPLADTEVVVDPLLDVLIIGDLFSVQTGAIDGPRAQPNPVRARRSI